MDASPEHLSSDELRRIASEYLHELLRHYEQLQTNTSVAASNTAHSLHRARLEQRVGELLSALTQFTNPQERRDAVLQVLCGRKERQRHKAPTNQRKWLRTQETDLCPRSSSGDAT